MPLALMLAEEFSWVRFQPFHRLTATAAATTSSASASAAGAAVAAAAVSDASSTGSCRLVACCRTAARRLLALHAQPHAERPRPDDGANRALCLRVVHAYGQRRDRSACSRRVLRPVTLLLVTFVALRDAVRQLEGGTTSNGVCQR